ncbi:MAG: hypothetical protein AAGD13_02775 [Pseudomonadota bacterium]
MDNIIVSRRSVLQTSGGALAATASGSGIAFAATEFDAMRSRIGERLTVQSADGSAAVTIEDVVRLGDPVRKPFAGIGRTPFAVVFRQEAGDRIDAGTHLFSSDGLIAQPIMVSAHESDDGRVRMEAVFN